MPPYTPIRIIAYFIAPEKSLFAVGDGLINAYGDRHPCVAPPKKVTDTFALPLGSGILSSVFWRER
jgi:hypothetical protein